MYIRTHLSRKIRLQSLDFFNAFCQWEKYCYIQGMQDKYKIPYINMCIRLFARRFQLSLRDAAEYLCRFKGVRFLDDRYAAEHLLPTDEALDDLVVVCKRNGGTIG